MLLLDFLKIGVIICVAWQRSSVVEQRNHNPLVGGPNPSAATKISRCSGIFYFVKISQFCPNLSVLADIFTYILDIMLDIKTPPEGRWGYFSRAFTTSRICCLNFC